MKELIKKAFEDEKFVELFKKYCIMSQKFADIMIFNHNKLGDELSRKYQYNWVEGVIDEILNDDELIELSEIYRYIRL